MASNTSPVVDRIRIIPRPDDFLDRNVGSSGEVFFDKQANTLRVYSGKLAGGYTVVTEDNLARNVANSKIATVTYLTTVTSAQGGDVGNKYVLNGTYRPDLNFVVGYTYVFDQTDLTNVHYPNANGGLLNEHQLAFSSDDPSGEVGGGTAYEDNVRYFINDDPVTRLQYYDRFNEAITRQVQITVTSSTPSTLYYWCKNHAAMGATITVAEPGSGSAGGGGGASVDVSDTAPATPTQGSIWFDSTNGKFFVYVTDVDSSQWVQPTTPLPSVNTFKNISVTGGSTLVASGNSDTVNFAPGSNITLDVDGATNTITINSSGGGGSTYDQNLNTTNDVTFDDITATGILTASSINAAAIQNTGVGNPTFTSASTIDFIAPDGIRLENILKTNEVLTNIVGATGTVTFNYSAGPIFNVTTPAANWTADITNVPTTDNRATNTAIIITQGTTPYVPNVIQIAGVTQTIKWIDNVAPSGNANKTDVITLSMLRVGGSWNVLGSYVNYG